jgi:hypothetical protein
VQSVGGFVDLQIEGQRSERRIGAKQVLPVDAFRIVGVNLYLNDNADDTGMTNLKGLTAIRSLNIHGAKRISNTGLQNAGLENMQSLQDLGPVANGVDERILEKVVKLTNLRVLTLDGLRPSNNALQQLGGLKKLETLSLSFTSVTDAGLEQLYGLTNLKSVRLLNANNVTTDGVNKLRGALPKCKVEQ